MVYELKHTPLLDGDDLTNMENMGDGEVGDTWEIAKWIAKLEFPKHRNKTSTEFHKQKRTLQSCAGRYMRQADIVSARARSRTRIGLYWIKGSFGKHPSSFKGVFYIYRKQPTDLVG